MKITLLSKLKHVSLLAGIFITTFGCGNSKQDNSSYQATKVKLGKQTYLSSDEVALDETGGLVGKGWLRLQGDLPETSTDLKLDFKFTNIHSWINFEMYGSEGKLDDLTINITKFNEQLKVYVTYIDQDKMRQSMSFQPGTIELNKSYRLNIKVDLKEDEQPNISLTYSGAANPNEWQQAQLLTGPKPFTPQSRGLLIIMGGATLEKLEF